MSNNPYAAYFGLEKQLKAAGHFPARDEVVSDFTKGKKNSLKALEHVEYTNLINWMRSTLMSNKTSDWQKTPENQMRRKLWNIFCKEMGYSQKDFQNWFIKYGKFHKPLNKHTKEELQLIIPIAQKVLESYIKSINK